MPGREFARVEVRCGDCFYVQIGEILFGKFGQEGAKQRVREINFLFNTRLQEFREECAKVMEDRYRKNGFQWGCGGKHRGIGTKDCPVTEHHHHDEFCVSPWEQIRRLGGPL